MDSSSGPTVFRSEHISSGEENPEKNTHPKASKWYASSYGTKYTSDPEMLAAVDRPSIGSTYEISNANHGNGIRANNQQAVSLTSVSSSTHKRGSSMPPLDFGRVAVELSTIKDITRVIRNEVTGYSNLERRYVRELEKKLPECVGMGDIRMHMTVEQLERIRRYRRAALAELTDLTVRIAALESRVERIAYEAAEAELNAKLVQLESLYCEPEMDVASPTTSTISTLAAPTNAPKTEPLTNAPQTNLNPTKNPSPPNNSRTKYIVSRSANAPDAKESRLVQPTTQITKGNILAILQEIIEKPNQSQIQSQIENTHLHIPNSISTVPTTNMSNEQITALRELLTDYKNKKAETLSTSETDKVVDNDSTSSVDSGRGEMVMQQPPQRLENEEDDGESIEDLLKEARESRNRLYAHSIMVSTRINSNNKKLHIAVVAGSSVAAAMLMLEARTGMISKAFSSMFRMLG